MRYPVTPDGRYFVAKGQLWRCTNPNLAECDRTRWVKALMKARRSVKTLLKQGDIDALKAARQEVDNAKTALGERGPVWWTDGAPDYNREQAKNTPYATWYATLNKHEPSRST